LAAINIAARVSPPVVGPAQPMKRSAFADDLRDRQPEHREVPRAGLSKL
jgi:hypothetical protein